MPLLQRPRRITLGWVVVRLLAIIVVAFVGIGSTLTLAEGRYTLANWQSFIISGIALGSVYALVALGYTLVYGILFMINFAHGEVFMMGTYTAFFLAIFLADAGMIESNPVTALLLTLGLAMLTSMTVAVILERIAYRPLRGAPRLVPLITAIGASFFLQYSARGMYGARVRAYPDFGLFRGTIEILGVNVPVARLVVIVAAVGLMLTLYFFINKTRTGRAMRAVSEDKNVAAMMGINVDRVIATTFAIGGLLAGAAGILYIQLFNQVA
jgi:branched-chain amino acid transport system permease protein